MTDDEYAELQQLLMADPLAGDVVPESGGVRKVRWSAAGRGKRGGLRVIYYARVRQRAIWMLTMYPKNVKETIPGHILKKIRKEIDG